MKNNTIKVTTSSGFKCEIDPNVSNDWRLLRAIRKCQHEETAFEGGIELESILLKDKGSKALEAHLEALDGYVDAEKLFSELLEIIQSLSTSKN